MENKKVQAKYFIGIILILLVILLGVYIKDRTMTANVIKEQINEQIEEQRQKELESERYKDWLVENCECLENNHIKCSEGYELIEGICRNTDLNTYTSRLLACSKYDCDGEIKEINLETGLWENE